VQRSLLAIRQMALTLAYSAISADYVLPSGAVVSVSDYEAYGHQFESVTLAQFFLLWMMWPFIKCL